MEIIKKVYWNWKTKILFDWDIYDETIIEEICNRLDIQLHILDISLVLKHLKRNYRWYVMPRQQVRSLCNPYVQEYNSLVKEYIFQNKVTHIHVSTFIFHHSFIEDLKKYNVEFSTRVTDDPELSKWYTKPFIKYFDKWICSWVMYNKTRLISDSWREWWCKNVKFIPTYPNPKHYNNEPIDYSKKDIDVIYIWSINIAKIRWISILKKHFWDRMKLYWRYWNWDFRSIKWIIYKFLNWWFEIWFIQEVSSAELLGVYKRAKIWVNIHITSYKWPSNVRNYELPLNWVMQISDNKIWYKYLYEDWKEIVCYDNMREAIEKIEYFLENEKERNFIAMAWYKKARKEFTYEKILFKTLEFIIE